MSLVRVGDIRIQVAERGQGQPLLLVHGYPLDHAMWRGQLDGLAETVGKITTGWQVANIEHHARAFFEDELNLRERLDAMIARQHNNAVDAKRCLLSNRLATIGVFAKLLTGNCIALLYRR